MQNMPTNRDATFPRRQTDMSAHIRRTLWNGLALLSYVLSVHRLQTDASGAYGGVYIHFIVPYLSVVRSSLPTRKLRQLGCDVSPCTQIDMGREEVYGSPCETW